MHRSTRLIAGAALSGALVLAAAAPAMAYDCFNASRSNQGASSAAAHSGNWYSPTEFIAAAAPDILGRQLTSSELAAVSAAIAADPRIPSNFAIFFNTHHPGELAHKLSYALATNGKGIDHSDDVVVDSSGTTLIDAVIQDAGAALGLGG
jgi:hypothetical protein